jgi:hypothetical protein
MQVLDIQPSNPTPYTPAGGTYNNNPTPGAGGLPALSGLNTRMNPLAHELQGQGRGEDSVLVHMTPNEVNSLRGLAQAFGGDLSMNPNTGLPEAGFLSKILPTLLGVGLSFIPGVGPLAAAGIVGAGTTAVTGDLQKGLMAGLGAYGGASLGGALSAAPTTAPVTPGVDLTAGAARTAATSGLTVPADILATASQTAAPAATTALQTTAPSLAQAAAAQAPKTLLTAGSGAAAPSSGILGNFGKDFAAASREGLKAGTMPYKFAPYAAGLGVIGPVSEALQPQLPEYEKEEDKWKYEGPYLPMPRKYSPRATGPEGKGEIMFFEQSNPYPGYMPAPRGFAEGGATKPAGLEEISQFTQMYQTSPGPITASRTYEGGSPSERIRAAAMANVPAAAKPTAEIDYGFAKSAGTPGGSNFPMSPYMPGFDYSTLSPEVINSYIAKYGFGPAAMDGAGATMQLAKGGDIHMDDGAFVVDARTVSELGNGSSSAGQELLARMGGRPVKGPGDGVSDSIPAKIGGTQEARVARDEVIFSADAVKKVGGAKKLYALMDKAHKARKKAGRGTDTKLRKGLGAL